jgi:hypothetical protein
MKKKAARRWLKRNAWKLAAAVVNGDDRPGLFRYAEKCRKAAAA